MAKRRHDLKAALRRMLPRNRGLIIQVGSALVYRGIPLQSAYCAAKHAIRGFVDSLRCELIHDKSRVQPSAFSSFGQNRSWKVRLPRKIAARAGEPARDLPADH